MASEIKQKEQEQSSASTDHAEIISTLPKSKGWWVDNLFHYKGFCLPSEAAIKCLISLQSHSFTPKPDDVILSTSPKCGTTWLRALLFAITSRNSYHFSTHPLLTSSPEEFVPFLERYLCFDPSVIHNLPSPRLLSTHLPFSLFPQYLTSACRLVYICRDPKDVIVSKWHFAQKLRKSKKLPPLEFKDAFEMFCNGVSHYGSYWDHVLSYWKASLEAPNKVLFLKYEDVKSETMVHVKRLAEFIGKPFSAEEEKKGVVDEIIRLCSFEKLSNLEVNKPSSKSCNPFIQNFHFFRKGEVGDWKNHLSAQMAARVDQITKERFHKVGLRFD